VGVFVWQLMDASSDRTQDAKSLKIGVQHFLFFESRAYRCQKQITVRNVLMERRAGRGAAGTGVAGRGVAGRSVAGRGVAGRGVAGRGAAGRGVAGRIQAGRRTPRQFGEIAAALCLWLKQLVTVSSSTSATANCDVKMHRARFASCGINAT